MSPSLKEGLPLGGFQSRGLAKVYYFVSNVAPYLISRSRTVDLCSGNGLCSFVFIHEGFAKRALIIDRKFPKSFERIKALFEGHNLNPQYVEEDLNKLSPELFNPCEDFLISIHPCGNLADKIIQIGLDLNIPFALMTCCHLRQDKSFHYSLKNPPDSRLMIYDEPQDYHDLIRQRYIEERGWICHRREIPKRITPRNHILIGLPR
jgi:hypothetical protein